MFCKLSDYAHLTTLAEEAKHLSILDQLRFKPWVSVK